jgi:hypothetical protein
MRRRKLQNHFEGYPIVKSAVPLKRISNVATTLFLRKKTFKKSKFLSCDSLSLSLHCPDGHTDLEVVPQNTHTQQSTYQYLREREKPKKKQLFSKLLTAVNSKLPEDTSCFFVRGFAEFSREGKKEKREREREREREHGNGGLMTDFWKLKNWSNLQPPENRSKVEEGIPCFSWFPFNPYQM